MALDMAGMVSDWGVWRLEVTPILPTFISFRKESLSSCKVHLYLPFRSGLAIGLARARVRREASARRENCIFAVGGVSEKNWR